jgi:hypothetical protein
MDISTTKRQKLNFFLLGAPLAFNLLFCGSAFANDNKFGTSPSATEKKEFSFFADVRIPVL